MPRGKLGHAGLAGAACVRGAARSAAGRRPPTVPSPAGPSPRILRWTLSFRTARSCGLFEANGSIHGEPRRSLRRSAAPRVVVDERALAHRAHGAARARRDARAPRPARCGLDGGVGAHGPRARCPRDRVRASRGRRAGGERAGARLERDRLGRGLLAGGRRRDGRAPARSRGGHPSPLRDADDLASGLSRRACRRSRRGARHRRRRGHAARVRARDRRRHADASGAAHGPHDVQRARVRARLRRGDGSGRVRGPRRAHADVRLPRPPPLPHRPGARREHALRSAAERGDRALCHPVGARVASLVARAGIGLEPIRFLRALVALAIFAGIAVALVRRDAVAVDREDG